MTRDSFLKAASNKLKFLCQLNKNKDMIKSCRYLATCLLANKCSFIHDDDNPNATKYAMIKGVGGCFFSEGGAKGARPLIRAGLGDFNAWPASGKTSP